MNVETDYNELTRARSGASRWKGTPRSHLGHLRCLPNDGSTRTVLLINPKHLDAAKLKYPNLTVIGVQTTD